MKVDVEPKWSEDLSRHALNSLSLNNARIEKGSEEVLETPSLASIPDAQLFEGIESILGSVRVTDQLREIEDANRERFGPRSIAIPWEQRKASLYAYFDDKSDYDPGGLFAKSGRLQPTSLDAAAQSLIGSSSAGLPYLVRKSQVLPDALRNHAQQVGEFPCVLYTRTQEEKKTRNVWGYPISDTLDEQTFFRAWLLKERMLPTRAALLGPDTVDKAVSELLALKTDTDLVVCVDFSSYDASIAPQHSYAAFQQVANSFQASYHDDLYRLYRRFITIPIWTPDGEVTGLHGVPSGSSFTNTIDSLVQLQVGSDWADRSQVQGDDGVYIVPQNEHSDFVDAFKSAGLKLNEDKSEVFGDRQAVYLQRYYSTTYPNRYGIGLGGVYSLYRAMMRLKYLERWTDFDRMGISGSDFFSLRAIMILENCKHHPGFDQFVQYVHSIDGKGLEYTDAGLRAYSRAQESRNRAGVISSAFTTQGINGFETMKLLRSL